MAVDLDKLMALKGAIAAGEFGVDGKLVAYKGQMKEEHAKMVAMMCAANSLMGKMQAEGFTAYTGMKWSPFKGWAVSAGDYSVCVMGNVGVFVETAKASFDEIFKTLGQVAGVL
jgi:roadblock/LC7 domain-containing protein